MMSNETSESKGFHFSDSSTCIPPGIRMYKRDPQNRYAALSMDIFFLDYICYVQNHFFLLLTLKFSCFSLLFEVYVILLMLVIKGAHLFIVLFECRQFIKLNQG